MVALRRAGPLRRCPSDHGARGRSGAEARMTPGAHPEVWAEVDGVWTWVPSPMDWYRSPTGSFDHRRPTDA